MAITLGNETSLGTRPKFIQTTNTIGEVTCYTFGLRTRLAHVSSRFLAVRLPNLLRDSETFKCD